MLGKDLKELFNKIPDNARVMVKMQGYGDMCRDAEEKDFNFKFIEQELIEVEDHYVPNNEPFIMFLNQEHFDEMDGSDHKHFLKRIKILSKFKAIVLKKSGKP